MSSQNAIIVFSKPPHISRTDSSEPYASLPWDDVDKLFSAFLVDIIQSACRVPDTDVLFYRDPSEPLDEYLYPLRDKITFCNLEGGTFTEQVQSAVEKTFANGYSRVIVVLDNHPTLSAKAFMRIFEQLKYEDECVVLGPTIEGKTFLIGLKANQSQIFDEAEGDPLEQQFVLLERICQLEAVLFLIQQKYLLNSGFGIARLREELESAEVQESGVADRTYEVFKSFDKKYRMKHSLR